MLRRLAQAFVEFVEREDGPTAVEYAVMLTFIILVCFAAVQSLGKQVRSTFQNSTLTDSLKSEE
ncbi:Flp family type IVb pilin [Tuwongella immobilis]|jgi:pilus assembly protein Flp/PilA|uniref:Flp family type IVb pilin n=1 Tax=Tuwongella immobilis TaxID=692036 RepID=A0A6C2YWX8_9BACT|nr:Flp family type IVb pilin [Tuwongella immobilis]VIP05409.1 Flp/Fap pilin component OS=Blastopirellula marina DSM 3645 GN=DSM3645_06449 PE=4 SV=1: Flp_Fap [Tuwongella immobilis]VTS08174.1 Flp/Fap pilin component OS=Blastopirellula marina DSM 3645 GN=DSM3645_06449 PE=4 SV=1: Flp_Fap [Tuwongella immobilis]